MRKTILAAAFMVAAMAVYGQKKDHGPGYVIYPGQDTLFGELANRHPSLQARTCQFRPTDSEQYKELSPTDIDGYRYTPGKYYVSRQIVVDGDSLPVFLEYLVKGALDILYYMDPDMYPHYYAATDSLAMVELVYAEELLERDGAYLQQKTKTHQYQLSVFTSDHPELMAQIQRIEKPEHEPLIALARKYDKLVNGKASEPEFLKKKPSAILLDLKGGFYSFVPEQQPVDAPGMVFLGHASVLFQQGYLNEFLYLGIGISYVQANLNNGARYIGLPLSVNYLRSRQGLSPMFSYEIDLGNPKLHEIRAGIRYNLGKASFYLAGEMRNELFSIYGYGASVGMMMDLR